MIKKSNGKKKKGFTLIELIIVLAVMAIIALIAIPNFTAVRENSKEKADAQSIETIKRTVLMLVADETVTTSETVVVTASFNDNKTFKEATADKDKIVGLDKLNDALKEVKKPQANGDSKFTITIQADGEVDVTKAK